MLATVPLEVSSYEIKPNVKQNKVKCEKRQSYMGREKKYWKRHKSRTHYSGPLATAMRQLRLKCAKEEWHSWKFWGAQWQEKLTPMYVLWPVLCNAVWPTLDHSHRLQLYQASYSSCKSDNRLTSNRSTMMLSPWPTVNGSYPYFQHGIANQEGSLAWPSEQDFHCQWCYRNVQLWHTKK